MNLRSGLRSRLMLALALVIAPLAAQPPGEPPNASRSRGRNPALPKLTTLEQWRRCDQELIDAAQGFISIDERRRKLVEELARSKKKFAPTDVSPSAIMARRAVTAIFTQYDQMLGDFRVLQNRTWLAARSAYGSRDELKTLLEARQAELEGREGTKVGLLSADDHYELQRTRLWVQTLARAAPEGPHQIVLGVIGPELGSVLLFSHSAAWRGDGPEGRTGGGPPFGRPREGDNAAAPRSPEPLSPKERREWLIQRKQELLATNLRSQERIEQRNREIGKIDLQIAKIARELNEEVTVGDVNPLTPTSPKLP